MTTEAEVSVDSTEEEPTAQANKTPYTKSILTSLINTPKQILGSIQNIRTRNIYATITNVETVPPNYLLLMLEDTFGKEHTQEIHSNTSKYYNLLEYAGIDTEHTDNIDPNKLQGTTLWFNLFTQTFSLPERSNRTGILAYKFNGKIMNFLYKYSYVNKLTFHFIFIGLILAQLALFDTPYGLYISGLILLNFFLFLPSIIPPQTINVEQ
jgi:hypothetical protein